MGGVDVMTATTIATRRAARAAKPWYKVLYIQVLIRFVCSARFFGWLEAGLCNERLDQGWRWLHRS